MEGCFVATYRCNFRCAMCNTWQFPSRPEEEIGPEVLEKLPAGMDFFNITGGEPFLRDDLERVVGVIRSKARRVVISTNGFLTERIVEIVRKYPDLGVRVSLEGLPAANDELRGIKNGFDHGLRTLLELRGAGCRDIGFAITVSDRNHRDMIELYRLAEGLQMEFATAATHNSFYFHKQDNRFADPDRIAESFRTLIAALLATSRLKNWYRAYFNYGLMGFVRGRERLLPCEAGSENFFVTPSGDVVPCNGSDEAMIMGNLREQSWDEIWNGPAAAAVRRQVRECAKNCWMVGTAAPVMKKYLWTPTRWVVGKKVKQILGRDLCLD